MNYKYNVGDRVIVLPNDRDYQGNKWPLVYEKYLGETVIIRGRRKENTNPITAWYDVSIDGADVAFVEQELTSAIPNARLLTGGNI